MRSTDFSRLVVGLAVLLLAGCTVSMATSDQDVDAIVPGYSPTLSDSLGSALSFSDVSAKSFQAGICPAADDQSASDYKLANGATNVSLSFNGADGGTANPTAAGKSKGGTADAAPTPSSGKPVSKCALKVLAAAVTVCVHRTAQRNVLDKLENYGVDQIIAMGGAAAGIAALTHASGKDTTLAVAGASGAAALATNLQKAVPSSTAVPISDIVGAGLGYLTLIDNLELSPIQRGQLFDVAFSACPITK